MVPVVPNAPVMCCVDHPLAWVSQQFCSTKFIDRLVQSGFKNNIVPYSILSSSSAGLQVALVWQLYSRVPSREWIATTKALGSRFTMRTASTKKKENGFRFHGTRPTPNSPSRFPIGEQRAQSQIHVKRNLEQYGTYCTVSTITLQR